MARRLVAIKDGVEAAAEGRRQQLNTVLAGLLPRRLVPAWLDAGPSGTGGMSGRERLAEIGHERLRQLGRALNAWHVTPAGSEGYRKAEVTLGGIATAELDPRTMQSRRIPGIYWIGEAVDVTGWLGGYNFQWAWASGHAAGMAVSEATSSGA
jgi:predicted flavoprotein YhiN